VTTTGDLPELRDWQYKSYVSQHSRMSLGDATRLVYRRDIRPLLPPPATGPIAGIGCGSGQLPNAVSPFGGHIRYGDFTHETWFTARSVRQLAAAAGLDLVGVTGCPPPVHGVASALRAATWKPVNGLFKLMLAAKTGAIGGHIVTQNLTFAALRPPSPNLPLPGGLASPAGQAPGDRMSADGR
jgi:hypothetical protein